MGHSWFEMEQLCSNPTKRRNDAFIPNDETIAVIISSGVARLDP
jgi:hypothetical protein